MKKIHLLVLGALLILILFIGFFLNNSESIKPQNNNLEKCIQNITSYYENNPGVISTETGSIFIGYTPENKNEIISFVEQYDLTLSINYGSMGQFNLTRGEEIQKTCLILNDNRIKDKISFIEPDIILRGTGN